MNRVVRILSHLSIIPWWIKKILPHITMDRLQSAIKEGESRCSGQIRVAIEANLSPELLWENVSARQRAIDVFSLLRVWDTENNNGILVYLLLADRDVEIVADRGIAKSVSQKEWEDICRVMETAFKEGNFESGLIQGVKAISTKLAQHFPASGERVNELPDKPYML